MTTAPYAGSDFSCDVAIPRTSELDVVHEDDRVLAFHHTRPSWPTHVVVVPERHLASLTTVTGGRGRRTRAAARRAARGRDVEEREGAAAVLTNVGRYQDSKHLHVHVSSGEPLR